MSTAVSNLRHKMFSRLCDLSRSYSVDFGHDPLRRRYEVNSTPCFSIERDPLRRRYEVNRDNIIVHNLDPFSAFVPVFLNDFRASLINDGWVLTPESNLYERYDMSFKGNSMYIVITKNGSDWCRQGFSVHPGMHVRK